MNALLSPRRFVLAGLLIAYAVTGCGKSGPKTVPVSGTVTVDGAPLNAGQVTFFPVDNTGGSGGTGFSGGIIDSAGKYTISTDGQSGAPLGKYTATVSPSMVPTGGTNAPALAFDRKFQDAKTSGLNVEVVASPAPGAYDLKVTKK